MAGTTRSNYLTILGYAAVTILAGVMIMQLLLAAGILPASMAWGGGQDELTPSLRLSSLAAFLILGGFAYVIARRSGILGSPQPSLILKIVSWLITLYLGFNSVLNMLSPSLAEKWIFGPITILLTGICLVISASRSTPPDGSA
jgi:hypothetical protein